jgi:hypothetical protein
VFVSMGGVLCSLISLSVTVPMGDVNSQNKQIAYQFI